MFNNYINRFKKNASFIYCVMNISKQRYLQHSKKLNYKVFSFLRECANNHAKGEVRSLVSSIFKLSKN